jgi:hypothetical protein
MARQGRQKLSKGGYLSMNTLAWQPSAAAQQSLNPLRCFGMLAGSLRKQDDAGDDQSRQNETGARGPAIARSWHGCADEITPKS